jgi:hypothetical protein
MGSVDPQLYAQVTRFFLRHCVTLPALSIDVFLEDRMATHGHLFEHERCLEDDQRVRPDASKLDLRKADIRYILANHLHSVIAFRWHKILRDIPGAARWPVVISRELLSATDPPDVETVHPDTVFYWGIRHAATCGHAQHEIFCDTSLPDSICRILHSLFVKYVFSRLHTVNPAAILYQQPDPPESARSDIPVFFTTFQPVPRSIYELYKIMALPLSTYATSAAWRAVPPVTISTSILSLFINRELASILTSTGITSTSAVAGADQASGAADSRDAWWTTNTMDAIDDTTTRHPLVVRVFLEGIKPFTDPSTAPIYVLAHRFILLAMRDPILASDVFQACAIPLLVLATIHVNSHAQLEEHCRSSAGILQYHNSMPSLSTFYHALDRACATYTVSIDAALAVSFGLADSFADAEAALAALASETADSAQIIEHAWPQNPAIYIGPTASNPMPYTLVDGLIEWESSLKPHPLYPTLSFLTILFSRRSLQFLRHTYFDDRLLPAFLPTVASAITANAVAITTVNAYHLNTIFVARSNTLDQYLADMHHYIVDRIAHAQFVHLFDTLLHDRVVALNCPICTYAIALFVLIPDVYFNTPEVDARRNYQTAVVARLLLHTPNLVCLLLAALWDSRAPQIHATLFPTSRYIGHNAFELNFLFNNTVQPVATDVHALRLRLQNQVLSSPSLLDSLASPADAESIKASFRRMRVIRSQDTAPLVRCPHCTPPPYCRS